MELVFVNRVTEDVDLVIAHEPRIRQAEPPMIDDGVNDTKFVEGG